MKNQTQKARFSKEIKDKKSAFPNNSHCHCIKPTLLQSTGIFVADDVAIPDKAYGHIPRS